ncbi:hypothetical protein BDV26DRAFT_259045 [Aspergillus bertholletiae]|uniref:Uncharacterized protein n=1 Tax=Aspergillus bertholletiae TaxID=1226010 RepID=A0A5N7BCQ2_9EURO|nr:hypothetical protein BDV26DRAFT_259045 [Aspergillus bertholletiae]
MIHWSVCIPSCALGTAFGFPFWDDKTRDIHYPIWYRYQGPLRTTQLEWPDTHRKGTPLYVSWRDILGCQILL